MHRLILDGPERSIVRDFLKITQLYPLPSPGVQYPPRLKAFMRDNM